MSFKKGFLIGTVLLGLIVSISAIFFFYKRGCSATYWLNPDRICLVRDELENRLLVEYFDADTNELLLYIQQGGNDLLIEHPHGRVKNYSTNIRSNEIRLDPLDSRYILVNGERFEIVMIK